MERPRPTLLGYILLGLLRKRAQSGYDLRRLFATTPLMSYSDSPGAIYPALRRLKESGLVEERARKGRGVRDRRVCQLTADGVAVLREWLSQPVSRVEIVRDVGLFLMRFSLTDAALGPRGSRRLLESAEPMLTEHVTGLKSFLRTNGPTMSLSGRLALDYGVRSYVTLLQWTRDAISDYARQP